MRLYLKKVNDLVKEFDRDLYARERNGVIQVCHMKRSWEEVYIDDGFSFLNAKDNPYLVFSLTDTWNSRGTPVNWGYMPLREKMQLISFEQRDAVFKEMEELAEKRKQSRDRDRLNTFEAIADEVRPIYKKAFSDINTSTMDKKDRRWGNERIKKWV